MTPAPINSLQAQQAALVSALFARPGVGGEGQALKSAASRPTRPMAMPWPSDHCARRIP
jgi:hypothetical protein